MKDETGHGIDFKKIDEIKIEQSCPTCNRIMEHYSSMSILTKEPVIVFNCTNNFCKNYNTEVVMLFLVED